MTSTALPPPGEQFRLADIYDSFFLAHSTPVRIRVDQLKDDVPEPYNLLQFDSVELVITDDDDAATVVHYRVAMTVLTGAGDLVDGIPCRVEGTVLMNDPPTPAGVYRAKLQGLVAGVPTIIEKPWRLSLFVAGPV